MASEHNGEKAGGKAVTVTKLNDPKTQQPSVAMDTNASKLKLVAPVAAIPTGLAPVGSNPSVLVKDALASVTQNKSHVQPTQGKRVILTPLQTAPTPSSTSSSSTSSFTIPSVPPSSSALLAPVRGAISFPLSTPVPPQSATVYVDGGDHERPYHLRPVPPLIQDVLPPLQQMAHNGIAMDATSKDSPVLNGGGGGGALASDHSYAAREPLATSGGVAPDHTTPLSDSTEEMSGASSDEGSSSGVGISLIPESGTGTKMGPSSAPPKLLKKRGRPPNSATFTPGAKILSEGLSPSLGGGAFSSGDRAKRRGRGCGTCPSCLRDDCGICRYCKDKPKFGGPGKKKQRCALRICSNFVSLFKSM